MDEKEKTILDAMRQKDKPVRPGDIATRTGIDKGEVSKIITRLKKEGKVNGSILSAGTKNRP